MKDKAEEITDAVKDKAEDVIEAAEETAEKAADTVKEKAKEGRMAAVQYVIKGHKKALLNILATLDGIPIEEYRINVIQIPIKVTELLNDKDLMDFFQSQGLTISDESCMKDG